MRSTAAAVVVASLLLPLALASPVQAEGPVVVVVVPVREEAFPLTVEAIGTARANESIEIRSHISESVRAIRFEEGQRVKAGDVLLELNDAEVLADVAAARASLVEATSRHLRAVEMQAGDLIAESELELLEARRDAARAALDAAEARLAETVIRAPFAGRVGLRRVSPGGLVSPSVVITTLDDNDTIKLDFDVPETAISLLEDGLVVHARSAAWPDSTFTGKVVSVNTRVDPVSRTVTVRARVPNGRGLLRAGMFLTVRLVRGDVNAMLIPEEAVVPERSQQFALVVGDDGIVEKREIRLGRRRPGEVEVLLGLSVGERVIVEGTQKARPGSPVDARLREARTP